MAKGISMRPTATGVIVTVPVYLSGKRIIIQALNSHTVKLLEGQEHIRLKCRNFTESENNILIAARRVLPDKLSLLSEKHGLPFNKVTIRRIRTRWGSCSTKKNISLSCYLLSLPDYLAEYVMLHELCHTVEMNHGEQFWALLDSNTSGKAKELRSELRKHLINTLNPAPSPD